MSTNISVVMSVYNGEKYLRPAIESILNQTFSGFEFIIIDDGSSDRSADIIKSYRDSRIRLIEQKNCGLSRSLNRGIWESRSKYIARMDADDISLSSRFAKQVDYLDRHPDVGVLGTAVRVIDGCGNESHAWRFLVENDILRWHLCFNDPIMHPTVMMRRGLVIRAGGYSADMGTAQDYDLWRRLSGMTRLSNLHNMLLYLRKHKDSVTSKHLLQQEENGIKISQLMISEVLGKDIPIQTVKFLWSKEFKSLNDVYKAANLIHRLYQAIVVDDSLLLDEKQMVRKDAARRLFGLVRQRTYDGYAWNILGLACRLDPLVVGRTAARRLHYILRN